MNGTDFEMMSEALAGAVETAERVSGDLMAEGLYGYSDTVDEVAEALRYAVWNLRNGPYNLGDMAEKLGYAMDQLDYVAADLVFNGDWAPSVGRLELVWGVMEEVREMMEEVA
jgi:hypothetical protein